jgi:RNA polymerase sigma-70 factor (ECF subfamily)
MRLEKWDDHESWRDFFGLYSRFIRRLAVRSGLAEAEADDVVQETVISVARQIHNFRRDRARGSFRGWLHRITRRRIADRFRSGAWRRDGEQCRRRECPESFNESNVPGPAAELELSWDVEWKASLLEAALARVKRRIKEEDYQLFNAYALKGWPVAKVARLFRVSAAKVYVTKHRVSALVAREVRDLEKRTL